MSTGELIQIGLTVSNLLMTGLIAYYRLSIKELRVSIALLISVAKTEVLTEVEKKYVLAAVMEEMVEHRDTLRNDLADRLRDVERIIGGRHK